MFYYSEQLQQHNMMFYTLTTKHFFSSAKLSTLILLVFVEIHAVSSLEVEKLSHEVLLLPS